ncbi:hypothetical protein EDB83DRAFT_2318994 [Lactarius deliciosus]|nr:hypothetical protein EDB83DRAFT_2318994 [Lactarius deliciosus]
MGYLRAGGDGLVKTTTIECWQVTVTFCRRSTGQERTVPRSIYCTRWYSVPQQKKELTTGKKFINNIRVCNIYEEKKEVRTICACYTTRRRNVIDMSAPIFDSQKVVPCTEPWETRRAVANVNLHLVNRQAQAGHGRRQGIKDVRRRMAPPIATESDGRE